MSSLSGLGLVLKASCETNNITVYKSEILDLIDQNQISKSSFKQKYFNE